MRTGLAVLMMFLVLGCTKQKEASKPQSLVEAGKARYNMNCIACHNADPRKDGTVGPAVWGSSLELVEARVLRAEYPAGYTAKRTTHQMVALPFLKDDIPALHAYLNAP